MASPQIEDGHVDIANEIVEKLARFQLSGTEYRVLWAIWRKTWGWHKKEDRIALSQFVKMTELKRRSVRRALESLVKKNIIVKNFNRVKKAPNSINYLRFNKDYETWETGVKNAHRGQKCAQKQVQKCALQKKRKKTIQKILNKEYFDLVDLLIEKMLQNDPKAKVPNTEKKRNDWANNFRLLIENDKRPLQEAKDVLSWCQDDSFWRANILSAGTFRKKYPKLRLQMGAKQKPYKPDPAELTRKEMRSK